MNNSLPKLVVLAGKSCSGKDSVFDLLTSLKIFERVVTYTTRPKRTNETDGVDYHFCSDEEFLKLDLVESREYNTIKGVWRYGSSLEGLDPGKLYGMILTPSGVEAYKKRLGENVLVIHLKVEDEERFFRALAREKEELNPDYDELARRWLADRTDFVDFNADVVVDNTYGPIMQTVNNISQIIDKWA